MESFCRNILLNKGWRIGRFYLYALAGLVLFSCNNKPKTTPHFLDLSARDTTVRPQDNFFEYANGTWLKNMEIPKDKVVWGVAFIVEERIFIQTKEILDSCAALKHVQKGTSAQQIGDLYSSAMDSTSIQKAGLAPLKADLRRIDAIRNQGGIINEVVQEYINGDWSWDWYAFPHSTPLMTLFVYTDDKNSNISRSHCNQGGLGLPNKTYYFKTDSASKKIVAAYKKYMAKILSLSGDSTQAETDANAIFSLETRLAQASKSPVELRDPQANYHLMAVDEMNKLTPNIHWTDLLNNMDIQEDTLLVGQPEFYQALSGLLKSEPVSVWKKYITFHLINRYARWLSSPFADAHFDFYGKVLSGRQKPEARWKRADRLIDASLGDALGQIYVKRYFPPSSKAYVRKMVDNLKAAYREHIKNLTWMSDSTKITALGKLNAIVKKIGYPDHWKDYSSADIDRGSLIGNLKRIGQWYYHYDVAKLHKPVDRSEWFMTPIAVNAYYNPTSNDINFPAGILQPPFYFPDGDDAINYGSVGGVIGHEMTHGFDDQGSQYDKNGNLKSWWTKADRKKFEKRAARIVNQFNHFIVLDSLHINGKLTEGENIADLGGLAIAYTAFQKTKESQSDTLINGLTPDQRFFLAYAQSWRGKIRPEMLRLLINSNPHAPQKYRVNGPVSNMLTFYKAFHVKPGDGMYRPDSLRVSLW